MKFSSVGRLAGMAMLVSLSQVALPPTAAEALSLNPSLTPVPTSTATVGQTTTLTFNWSISVDPGYVLVVTYPNYAQPDFGDNTLYLPDSIDLTNPTGSLSATHIYSAPGVYTRSFDYDYELSECLISDSSSCQTQSGDTFGTLYAAITVVPAATPLPAALPLFATGLCALGLFGWGRKQKKFGMSAAA